MMMTRLLVAALGVGEGLTPMVGKEWWSSCGICYNPSLPV